MLTYLVLVTFFLCILHIILNYNYRARLLRKIPGPKGVFICGNAFENICRSSVDIFEHFRGLANKYPTISKLWSWPYGLVNLYQPEDIEILLSTTTHNQKNIFYKFLESWLQDGILVSHGSKWQSRRKNLMPAFNVVILKKFCTVFGENSQRLVHTLKISQGKPIDLTPILSDFTLHTICETAMGIKLRDENAATVKSYIDAICGVGSVFVERSTKVYWYPECLYRLSLLKRKELKYADSVHAFTENVIAEKRNAGKGLQTQSNNDVSEDKIEAFYKRKSNTAFLDLLLLLQNDGLIDAQGVHEEVNTIMFEGHDTTSAALLFTFMLLANNKIIQVIYSYIRLLYRTVRHLNTRSPEATLAQATLWSKNNIVEELNEIFGDSDRSPTMEDLAAMRYMERCIKESLRLYPPVAMIGRLLSEETTFSGYKVPAGTHCGVFIYDIHRREDLYKDPLVFDPDRFLPENCVGRHPYAYIPFSAGPRNCIGQRFAMLEIKSVLSAVLREFNLEPITTPEDLKFRLDLILKCSVPVKVAFVQRKNN